MTDYISKVKSLTVCYHERIVGTLALYRNHLVVFEYAPEWIKDGFSISPFSLPLEKRLFIPKIDPFEGLFGVFSDSLPDGWGRLLLDRMLMKHGILSNSLSSLDRLAIVGSSGMGALTYHPEVILEPLPTSIEFDLDHLASECSCILETDYSDDLDELFRLGGSSGGARECGIDMSETKLFPSKRSKGYFGTRRFDRMQIHGGEIIKRHMISVSGLLETTHCIPNLDYHVLMKLTLELTKDFTEVEKMFRLMCFNVYAHNRDDHAKNFSYIYNEKESRWQLTPAYDLTYSFSLGGEHATCVNGNGKSPRLEDILAVGKGIGMKEISCKKIALEIREIVKTHGILHYP